MIPALLLFGSVALFAVGLYLWISGLGDYHGKEERLGRVYSGLPLGLLGLVLMFVVGISWPTIFYSSLGENARLEAFYDATLSAYEYAITETEDVEIKGSEAGLVDVAYMEQGKAQSERVRELRDWVAWYNKTLTYRRAFKETLFGVFALPPREDLKLIVLSSP